MIDYEIIENLGLSGKEAIVYMKCLEMGSAGIAELAKNSGIQRTHLYDLTKKLVSKGFLIQTRRDDKKVFSSLGPRELLRRQREKLKKFEDNIPILEKLNRRKNKGPKIIYYEGEDELRKMMASAASISGECLIWSDDYFYTKDNREYQKKNIAQRLRAKNYCRVLAALTDVTLETQKRDKKEARETRLFPRDLFEAKAHITIYKNKTMVVNHAKNFGFVVEDEDFSDTLKMIFNLTWKSGRLIG